MVRYVSVIGTLRQNWDLLSKLSRYVQPKCVENENKLVAVWVSTQSPLLKVCLAATYSSSAVGLVVLDRPKRAYSAVRTGSEVVLSRQLRKPRYAASIERTHTRRDVSHQPRNVVVEGQSESNVQ